MFCFFFEVQVHLLAFPLSHPGTGYHKALMAQICAGGSPQKRGCLRVDLQIYPKQGGSESATNQDTQRPRQKDAPCHTKTPHACTSPIATCNAQDATNFPAFFSWQWKMEWKGKLREFVHRTRGYLCAMLSFPLGLNATTTCGTLPHHPRFKCRNFWWNSAIQGTMSAHLRHAPQAHKGQGGHYSSHT